MFDFQITGQFATGINQRFKEENSSRASERLKQEQSERQQRVQEAIDEAKQKPGRVRGRSLTLDEINRIRERVYGLPPLAPQSEAGADQAHTDVAI